MDIYCPNFDHFLQVKLESITDAQLEKLIFSVQHKIKRFKDSGVSKMSLPEKMHILSIAFNRPVFIVVGSEEDGISPELFKEAIKARHGKVKNSKLLGDLVEDFTFVLGDKQVSESLLYMNHIQTTDIYNLIRMNNPREKSSRYIKFEKKHEMLKGVVDYFMKYESRKKTVLEQFNLTVGKLYGLLFLYDGEKPCKDFYDKQFKYAYGKDRSELSRALAEMNRDGYLSRRGETKNLKYSMTSKGIDLLIKVLNKLLYDI